MQIKKERERERERTKMPPHRRATHIAGGPLFLTLSSVGE